MNPPFSFRLRRKENGPFTVQKKRRCGPNPSLSVRFGQNGGRASRCLRKLIVSYRVRLGLREQRSASPQLGVWVRLSGWSSNGLSFSFRAPRYLLLSAAALRRLAPARACGRSRLALPGDSGKADSKPAERQRMENAGQIGLAPSDARWQSVAGGQPKISAGQGPPRKPSEAVFVGRGRASE